MATYISDLINIPRFLGYVRDSAVLTGPTLEGWVPAREVPDIEFELTQLESPHLEIARYRAWDTPAPLGKRPGLAIIKGEIMPISWSYTRNEKEVARLVQLRDASAADGGRVDEIFSDGANAARAVAMRFEQARADLLVDGKVTINENGVKVEADFGVPGGHIVTAGIAWSTTATAVPITNLKAWEATYRAANGGLDVEAWLISSEVAADLALNAQIRTLAPVTGVVPGIITDATISQVLFAAGVRAPLVIFDGYLPGSSGTDAVRTINARKVIGIRRGVAELFYGTTPQAQLAVANRQIERRDAAGIMAYVQEFVDPARVTTVAEGMGLPVLRDPKGLFVATV